MIRSLLFGLSALVAVACSSTTEPLPSGTTVLRVQMPDQDLIVDQRGNHLQITEIVLLFADPTLNQVPATEQYSVGEIQLTSGQRKAWARFDGTAGGETLQTTLQAATDRRGLLEPGMSMVLAGVYNGLLADSAMHYGAFVAALRFETELSVVAPPGGTNEEGRYYDLIVDPSQWLYDEDKDLIVRIEDLMGTGVGPEHATSRAVQEMFLENLRIRVR